MTQFDAAASKAAIAERVLDYWHDVDTNWGATAHEFFAEDGVFAGRTEMVGRREIKGFYDWRVSRGARVVRHIVTNLRVTPTGPETATARYIMTIWARDGEGVQEVSEPNAISQVTESFVRQAGQWMVKRKEFELLMKGSVPTTAMPEAELERLRAEGPPG
ncbi:nuclear transport factor 2 family protein [Pseudoroseicyclus sp. H15]